MHGEAPRVDVTVSRAGADVELTVIDAGRGFDVDVVRDGRGLGLVSMEERVHMIGGRVEVLSRPLQGTVIRAFVPAGAREPAPAELACQ
jgi:signal transduction histidine kinase